MAADRDALLAADAAAVRELRTTCWACGKEIKPDKAPRAICGDCSHGGYFGGS